MESALSTGRANVIDGAFEPSAKVTGDGISKLHLVVAAEQLGDDWTGSKEEEGGG